MSYADNLFERKSPFAIAEDLVNQVIDLPRGTNKKILLQEADSIAQEAIETVKKNPNSLSSQAAVQDLMRNNTAWLILVRAQKIASYQLVDSTAEDLKEAKETTRRELKNSIALLRKACCDGWKNAKSSEGLPRGTLVKKFKTAFFRDSVAAIIEKANRCDFVENGRERLTEELNLYTDENKQGYWIGISRLPKELARDSQAKGH